MPTPPPSSRYGFEQAIQELPEEIQRAHRFAFNSIQDLQSANSINVESIQNLQKQIDALQSTSTPTTTGTTTAGTTSGIRVTSSSLTQQTSSAQNLPAVSDRIGVSPTGQVSPNSSAIANTSSSYQVGAYISGINNQSGTTYSVQNSDYNGLVVFNTGSATTITLNSACSTNFSCSVMNIGQSAMTLTPTTGNVNTTSSVTLQTGAFAVVYYDGTNWWVLSFTGVLPATFTPVAHEFLTGYNATTGIFSAAQPSFADISGNLTTSQLPVSGLSVTITTAKLTAGGTNGSMTFTSGILTAQTPAT